MNQISLLHAHSSPARIPSILCSMSAQFSGSLHILMDKLVLLGLPGHSSPPDTRRHCGLMPQHWKAVVFPKCQICLSSGPTSSKKGSPSPYSYVASSGKLLPLGSSLFCKGPTQESCVSGKGLSVDICVSMKQKRVTHTLPRTLTTKTYHRVKLPKRGSCPP